MNNTSNVIINKIIKKFPSFRESFDDSENNSTQVVLFGSYAYGCEHAESDVDILFVGNKKRKSSKYFDFIWLKPERINSKTWLSSELAIHIANYGIWLKGNDAWRNQVFFSQAAATRKKQRIFERLIHIYLQKRSLSFAKKKLFIQKIIINTLRLQNLNNKIPNPPTCVTINELQDQFSFYQEIFEPHLLGPVGKVFFEEIFQNHEVENVLYSALNDLKEVYKII